MYESLINNCPGVLRLYSYSVNVLQNPFHIIVVCIQSLITLYAYSLSIKFSIIPYLQIEVKLSKYLTCNTYHSDQLFEIDISSTIIIDVSNCLNIVFYNVKAYCCFKLQVNYNHVNKI